MITKTDVQATVRHTMTAAGGAGLAASHDEIVQVLSALVGLLGLVWSIWEKRHPAPTVYVAAPTVPTPTQSLPARYDTAGKALLLAIGWLLFTPGCATAPGSSPLITPQRVESVTRLAAYVTARGILIKEPQRREQLTLAQAGFHALRGTETWDLQALGSIAATHGLTELSSEEGMLVLTGAVLFTDLFASNKVDLAKSEYARAVVIGADDGLALALGPGDRDAVGDTTLTRLRVEAMATRPDRHR